MSRDIVATFGQRGWLDGRGTLCGGGGRSRGAQPPRRRQERGDLQRLGRQARGAVPSGGLRGAAAAVPAPAIVSPRSRAPHRGRDHRPAPGAIRRRLRSRPAHHRPPPSTTRFRGALGGHGVAHPQASRADHRATPEAAQVVVHPLRGNAAQRALAGGHHALAIGRRQPRGDPQLPR